MTFTGHAVNKTSTSVGVFSYLQNKTKKIKKFLKKVANLVDKF